MLFTIHTKNTKGGMQENRGINVIIKKEDFSRKLIIFHYKSPNAKKRGKPVFPQILPPFIF